ncbi:MAG: formate dehydrogenase accessory sulfurtransferase FdhD [Nocardioidaceae bacterium]
MMIDRRPGPTTRVRVTEWRGDGATHHEDRVTTEEPLEVRVASPGAPPRRFGVTMRTPGHDFELAAGLLLSEGLVAGVDDVESVAYCTDRELTREQELNVVTVSLTVPPREEWSARQMSATSACGVCGTDSLESVEALAAPGRGEPIAYPARLLRSLPGRLRGRQRVFDRTGGLHAAGIFGPDGTEVVVREDVGRHNAVDKAVGHCLLNRSDPVGGLLCTSGRLGFEIVQKAVMSGIGAVVAVGAPTSLAVSLAERAGLTVAGFVRADRLVVYAGRVADADPSTRAPAPNNT